MPLPCRLQNQLGRVAKRSVAVVEQYLHRPFGVILRIHRIDQVRPSVAIEIETLLLTVPQFLPPYLVGRALSGAGVKKP